MQDDFVLLLLKVDRGTLVTEDDNDDRDDDDDDGDDEKEVQDDFVLLLLKVDRGTHVTDINQRYQQSRTNGGGGEINITFI